MNADSNAKKSSGGNVLNVIRVARGEKPSVKQSTIADNKRRPVVFTTERLVSNRSETSPTRTSSSLERQYQQVNAIKKNITKFYKTLKSYF